MFLAPSELSKSRHIDSRIWMRNNSHAYMWHYRSVDESTCFRCHLPVYLPCSWLYRFGL